MNDTPVTNVMGVYCLSEKMTAETSHFIVH